jgi:hypothetical protein
MMMHGLANVKLMFRFATSLANNLLFTLQKFLYRYPETVAFSWLIYLNCMMMHGLENVKLMFRFATSLANYLLFSLPKFLHRSPETVAKWLFSYKFRNSTIALQLLYKIL